MGSTASSEAAVRALLQQGALTSCGPWLGAVLLWGMAVAFSLADLHVALWVLRLSSIDMHE